MSRTTKLISAAICLALAVVLPLTMHLIPNGGRMFLPMHIPVLLCGFVCGPIYGLACGIIAPIISFFSIGMPSAVSLPGMMCELACYGVLSGLLFGLCKKLKPLLGIYIPLVASMLCGRLVSGTLNMLLFQSGNYSLNAWLTASFTIAVPGIIIQLILIPTVVAILKKANIIKQQKAPNSGVH